MTTGDEETLGLLDWLSVLFTRRTREERRRYKRAVKDAKIQAWAKNEERLQKAAGVSRVKVVCDVDTWEIIAKGLHERSEVRAEEIEKSLTVTRRLSGPHLVQILMHFGGLEMREGFNLSEGHVGRRVRTLVTEAVDAIDLNAKDGEPLPPIVIDHRVGDQS